MNERTTKNKREGRKLPYAGRKKWPIGVDALSSSPGRCCYLSCRRRNRPKGRSAPLPSSSLLDATGMRPPQPRCRRRRETKPLPILPPLDLGSQGGRSRSCRCRRRSPRPGLPLRCCRRRRSPRGLDRACRCAAVAGEAPAAQDRALAAAADPRPEAAARLLHFSDAAARSLQLLISRSAFSPRTVTELDRSGLEHQKTTTFEDLEPQSLSLLPSPIPIGPLLSSDHHPTGSLWPLENPSTIFRWLDSHPVGSVLYIAFGSHTNFSKPRSRSWPAGLSSRADPFYGPYGPTLPQSAGMQLSRPMRVELGTGGVDRGGAVSLLALFCRSIFERDLYMRHVEGWAQRGASQGWGRSGSGRRRDDACEGGEQIRKRVEEVMRDEEIGKRALVWKESATQNVNTSGTCHILGRLYWQPAYRYWQPNYNGSLKYGYWQPDGYWQPKQ
ncbi:UDP-glycosyltransferase 72B1 [Platanthera guangdongensis]|uniref:UDP-glycosyltransferase 72B1 n=1 Tax=Platanthera guangdongensis TaxID=2320717 RepID=A0ABR2MK46_9ASPA